MSDNFIVGGRCPKCGVPGAIHVGTCEEVAERGRIESERQMQALAKRMNLTEGQKTEWTKDWPTEPGLYWYRHYTSARARLAAVSMHWYGPVALVAFTEEPEHFSSTTYARLEWWPIPLTPPEERP